MGDETATNGTAATMRDELRAATLGGKHQFKRKRVKYKGKSYDVRQLSVGERGELAMRIRGSDGRTSDPALTNPWVCIFCVYVPDTDEKVFEAEDFDTLLKMPTGTFVDVLGSAGLEINGLIEAVDTVGNSDATAGASAS